MQSYFDFAHPVAQNPNASPHPAPPPALGKLFQAWIDAFNADPNNPANQGQSQTGQQQTTQSQQQGMSDPTSYSPTRLFSNMGSFIPHYTMGGLGGYGNQGSQYFGMNPYNFQYGEMWPFMMNSGFTGFYQP